MVQHCLVPFVKSLDLADTGEPVEEILVTVVKVHLDIEILEAWEDTDRKSTRLNSSHSGESRMPSSA